MAAMLIVSAWALIAIIIAGVYEYACDNVEAVGELSNILDKIL